MEKVSEIETKYQKLATEYSKVRSQATVLKKAVLDEQAKNAQLQEVIKKHEQSLRKHDQEMESLIFRNEQLAKRIMVLQEDLHISSNQNKKGKVKHVENNSHSTDLAVLDEEFGKKILENAQLQSSIVDKDADIENYKDRIVWLEEKLSSLENSLQTKDNRHKEQIEHMKHDNDSLQKKIKELVVSNSRIVNQVETKPIGEKVTHWEIESNKWKTECELLRSKPSSDEQLSAYYESQVREMLDTKSMAESECRSLSAENFALKTRLESLTLEHNELQSNLEKSYEELLTTNENYKSQLDAMTEHLAAQNEKITRQCDEIQDLKHRLSLKK